MPTDAELVKAVLDGRRECFAELVQRYERAACAAATDVLGDDHAAQDAAQEAFVAAYRKLPGLRDRSAFGAWVIKIARRQAARMARRSRPELSLEGRPDPPDKGRDGRLDEATQRLLSAVMRLPAHERTAVILRYFDGRDVQAIAEITGKPVGTITKQLSRAYARLRERLKDMQP